MKKSKNKRLNLLIYTFTLILILTNSLSCFASSLQLTANKTHTSSMHGTKFSLTGYFYYYNNTSTSITCDKLGFSLKNLGPGTMDTAVFNAFNGMGIGNNRNTTGDYYKDATFGKVEENQLVVHTTPPWHLATGVSATYDKYNNSAVFEMGAGPTEYDCASHQIWCYPDLSFRPNP